jgi:hypothetical protein
MTSFTTTNNSKTNSLVLRLTALGLFFIFVSPQVLYAFPRGDAGGVDFSPALRRPSSYSAPKIRVVGELSSTTESTGEQTINIKENQTGKTYQLSGDNETAKQFFKNGTRKVAIEGTISNDTILNVQSTEAF